MFLNINQSFSNSGPEEHAFFCHTRIKCNNNDRLWMCNYYFSKPASTVSFGTPPYMMLTAKTPPHYSRGADTACSIRHGFCNAGIHKCCKKWKLSLCPTNLCPTNQVKDKRFALAFAVSCLIKLCLFIAYVHFDMTNSLCEDLLFGKYVR